MSVLGHRGRRPSKFARRGWLIFLDYVFFFRSIILRVIFLQIRS